MKTGSVEIFPVSHSFEIGIPNWVSWVLGNSLQMSIRSFCLHTFYEVGVGEFIDFITNSVVHGLKNGGGVLNHSSPKLYNPWLLGIFSIKIFLWYISENVLWLLTSKVGWWREGVGIPNFSPSFFMYVRFNFISI